MNKQLLKAFIPPGLIKILKRTGLLNPYTLHWNGNFTSWQEASVKSKGYDSSEIVEKVKDSLLKVKNGEGAFERDSVLFTTADYNWPVISSLLFVAAQDGYLNVIDFGGSLGSTYFQHRTFFDNLKVTWNIIEQEHFVRCGKENFEDDVLRFYYDIETCMANNKINIIMLSSVLPYLERPYELLEKMRQLPVAYILLDKMPFIQTSDDRLTIQHIPASIYDASYPAWFFSESTFRQFISMNFRVLAEFENDMTVNIPSIFKGMLLEKTTNALNDDHKKS